VYRNEMHKKLGIKKENVPYIRLFTEKRMRGARSKYWGKHRALPIYEISVYVLNNPTFTANNEVYEVTFKDECSWDGQPSAGLYANKKHTMKPTKTVKPTKITKLQYHKSVSPAFCAWRKAMHKACNIETDMYCRLFTEKRSRGARTKYWVTGTKLPSPAIAKYIKLNPTFIADGAVYKVIFDSNYVSGSPYGYRSATIHAEKLNPIKFN